MKKFQQKLHIAGRAALKSSDVGLIG